MVNENLLGYSSLDDAINDTEYTSQVEALARMMKGESVFLSGVAGAGKSFVINRLVTVMQDFFLQIGYDPKELENVMVVSGATGLAAANLGGKTIHSVSGLGVCNVPLDGQKMFDSTYRNTVGMSRAFFTNYKKLQQLELLIIDEVSMMSALFVDNLNIVLQKAKKSNKPFGGVSMVFVGDFMQLPPVYKRGTHEKNGLPAFEADSWKELNPRLLFMKKSRRSQDDRLNKILEDMRESTLSPETKEHIQMCKNNQEENSYVRLFTRNNNVDKYNEEKLASLDGETFTFKTNEYVDYRDEKKTPNKTTYNKNKVKLIEAARKQLLIPTNGKIELKKGAVVTITTNFRDKDGALSVVNGDTGIITSIGKTFVNVKVNRTKTIKHISRITVEVPLGVPYKSEDSTKILRDNIIVEYLPIKLSFATTVHKSQGQTLDGVVVDLTNCFTPGLGYVAMSRVSNLDNLVITKIGKSAFSTDKKCADMSKRIEEEAKKNREEFKKEKESYETFINMPELLTIFWEPVK